jgi:hypothetical protein
MQSKRQNLFCPQTILKYQNGPSTKKILLAYECFFLRKKKGKKVKIFFLSRM